MDETQWDDALMETQTLNGVTYQRNGPGETWKRVGQSSGGGTYIPPSARTERKKDAETTKVEQDVQTGAAALPYVVPKVVADIGNTNASTAATNEKLIDALINRERGGVGEEMRGKALDAFNAAPVLEQVAQQIEKAYRDGVGQTSGVGGAKDFLPTGENREFGLIGGRMRGQLKQALGFTGGEGNTAGELTINYGPYIPDQYDSNEEVLRKLKSVRSLAREARKKAISYLGGIPDPAGRVTPLPRDMRPEQVEALYAGAPLEQAMTSPDMPASGMGRTGGLTSRGGFVPVEGLRGIENEVIQMVRNGAPASQINAFLSDKYAATSLEHNGRLQAGPEQQAWIADLVARHQADPSRPINELGSGWERLGGYEAPDEGPSFLGSVGETDFGAGAMSAANAVTGGNLANLAGGDARDVLSAARDASPKSSFAGDVFGSANAMAGVGGLGGKLGLGLLSRGAGIGGDMLYGGVRGASETEGGIGDKAVGGLFGLGAAGAGNLAGQYLVAPTIRGIGNTRAGRGVADMFANAGTGARNAYRGVRGQQPIPYEGADLPRALSRAENVISGNLPDAVDPIVEALNDGRAINMPVTLADVSPRLRNLGGASFRRANPETQEEIARLLTDRSAGQAGRAQNQLEASFGPLDDPLQASRSLMDTARTNAAPLYDAFRAQPARTSPELQAMMATPAGQRALQNARTIAANEGRDPNAMGFDLDELGQVVLRSDPSPETIDLVKRGLDDVLESYRDPTSGRLALDEGGRAVEGLRARYVQEADRLYPDTYPQARAAFAGPASENAALSAGQSMVGQHPRLVGQRIEGMGDGQLEQFRLGQRTAMGDAVRGARTTADPYQRIWGDPLDSERAAMVFGQPGADRFQQAYDVERAMAETNRAFIGGSPTQARQALDEQLTSQMGEHTMNAAVDTALTGAPVRGAVSLGQKVLGNRFARGREETASEIARLLATEQPTDDIATLLMDVAANRRYVDDLRSRYGGLGAAALTGAAIAQ